MAFTREQTRTATAIGDLIVHLYDPKPGSGEQAGSSYEVIIEYNDGTTQRKTGNLTTQLTPAQINQLLSFMATMRAKAVAEMLP